MQKSRVLMVVKTTLTGVLLGFILALVACGKTDYTDAEYYQRAQASHQKGELAAAIIELKNTLKKNPQHLQARLLLGKIYLKDRKGDAALKEFERAVQYGALKKDLLYDISQAYLLQNKNKEVLGEITPELIAATTDHVQKEKFFVIRGEAYISLKDYTKAKQEFDSAFQANPESITAMVGLARIAVFRSDFKQAMTIIDQILVKNANFPDVWVLRGEVYMFDNQLSAAEQAFTKVIDMEKQALSMDVVRARMGLVRVLLSKGDIDKARVQSEVLLKAAPKHPLPNYLRAQVAYYEKRFDTAETHLHQVLKVDSGHLPSVLLLGAIEYVKGNFNQAEKHLSRYLNENTGHLPARKLLAATRLRLKQPKEALAILNAATGADTQDAELLSLLGSATLQSGDYVHGKEILQKAKKADPENPEVRIDLARIYLDEGNVKQAIEELQYAINKDNSSTRAYKVLILSYLKSGEMGHAMTSAQELVKKDSKDPTAFHLLGFIYRLMNDQTSALNYWNQALKLNPNYFPSLMSVAVIDLEQGRYEAAKTSLNKIIDKMPENTTAYILMARLYAKQKKPELQLEWLIKANSNVKTELIPRVELTKYFAQRGQWDKAAGSAQEALSLAPENASVLMMAGAIEVQRKNYKNAKNYYNTAILKSPKTLEAYIKLAQLAVLENDTKIAKSLYQKALQENSRYFPAITGLAKLEMKTRNGVSAHKLAEGMHADKQIGLAAQILSGDLYTLQNDFQKALSYYQGVFSTKPSQLLMLKIYQTYQKIGQESEGVAQVVQWLEKNPKDIAMILLLAEYDQKNNHPEVAVEKYKTILLLQKNHIIALNNLAWLLVDRQPEEALNYAQQAQQMAPESGPVLDTLGWILVQKKDKNTVIKGVALLEKALKKMPAEPSTRYHLAVGYQALGRSAEAKLILKEIVVLPKTFLGKEEAKLMLERL